MNGFSTQQGIPGFTVRGGSPLAIPISTVIQQAVSLLMGYTYSEAIPLRASPAGILYVAEPRISDVEHWQATGANYTKQGDYKLCTQVLCIGHPDNTGLVWVAPRKTATADNGIPLAKNESITLSVENLAELNALIVVNGEKLIVAYSL